MAMYKGLYKVTTERVMGFKDAVKRLGTHKVCGHEVNYRTEYVRGVLAGELKSERMLELIAEKCPEMFEVCKLGDSVREWWGAHKDSSGTARGITISAQGLTREGK